MIILLTTITKSTVASIDSYDKLVINSVCGRGGSTDVVTLIAIGNRWDAEHSDTRGWRYDYAAILPRYEQKQNVA